MEFNSFKKNSNENLQLLEEESETITETEEIEESIQALQYEIFRNKGVVVLTEMDFVQLNRGEFEPPPNKPKQPFQKENLILEILPPELILTIAEFLPPGAIVRLSLTCKTLQQLCQDQYLWRQVSILYERYYVWDKLEVTGNNLSIPNNIKVVGFQADIPKKIQKIKQKLEQEKKEKKEKKEKQNINTDLSLTNQNLIEELGEKDLKKPKKIGKIGKKIEKKIGKKIEKKIVKKKFKKTKDSVSRRIKSKIIEDENSNYAFDSTTKRGVYGSVSPTYISVRSQRIEYIKLLKNPKKHLISKSQKLSELLELKEKRIQETMIQRSQNIQQWQNKKKIERSIYCSFSILHFGLIAFIALLNLQLEHKLDTKISYTMIPLFVPLIFIVVFFLIMTQFEGNESLVLDGGISFVTLIFFTGVLLIGLKLDSMIHISWFVVFSPFFVILTFPFLITFAIFLRSFDIVVGLALMMFLFLFSFLVLLALQLDHIISWNFAFIFAPIFLFDLVPLLGFVLAQFFVYYPELIYLSGAAFIIVIPTSIFEALVVVFLSSSSMKKITYAFFPLYVWLLLILIVSCPGFFYNFSRLLSAS
ncbi:fam11a b protein [Anaeramoeba ignava]|uniref:Fam11a b protein n=1 Tax=Anaeramoeba ignava TaxID=1746090 RepID=A0A9Q0L8S2_ANAIG|nr:fam11a b protein [Anaeramoeba ignava]